MPGGKTMLIRSRGVCDDVRQSPFLAFAPERF